MQFEKFQTMTALEATDFLGKFRENGELLLRQRKIDVSVMSADDLALGLAQLASQTLRVVLPTDLSIPQSIRNTQAYRDNAWEFTPESRPLVIAGGYLLGEWFHRTFENLSWSTGNQAFLTGGMPVIVGFRSNKEMPPLLIAENLFHRFQQQRDSSEIFETTIGKWVSNI
jgi:hypothetical protein